MLGGARWGVLWSQLQGVTCLVMFAKRTGGSDHWMAALCVGADVFYRPRFGRCVRAVGWYGCLWREPLGVTSMSSV